MSKHDPDVALEYHTACTNCPSSDALAVYSDGHGYCFSCNSHFPTIPGITIPSEQDHSKAVKQHKLNDSGEVIALTARGISHETCKAWHYEVGKDHEGHKIHIANYYKKGMLVAQKTRDKDKKFKFLNGKEVTNTFYGQWKWRDKGKRLIITEGELDCLSISQIQGNKWPVVSVPNGAAGATKTFKAQLEYLERWETVVIAFDNDKPGRDAAIECAALLSPGKARIVNFPNGYKDANDMLRANKVKDLSSCLWDAQVHRPDGIVEGADTWELIKNFEIKEDALYPFGATINSITYGMRRGELVTHTAGTGIGKTTICKEIMYDLGVRQNQKVGIICLEENTTKTVLSLMSLNANKRLDIQADGVTADLKKESWDNTMGTKNFFIYDHWGSLDSENLLGKIRYLVKGCGCDWIFLDHISIVVSGSMEGDERRTCG